MDAVTEKIIWSMKREDFDVIIRLKDMGCKIEPCGSRVTCSPPPETTDRDFLVEAQSRRVDGYFQSDMPKVIEALQAAEFVREGDESYHHRSAVSNFTSWRREDVNVILTNDPEFAKRHRAATYACQRLNVMEKDFRIVIFQAVLYGEIWKV